MHPQITPITQRDRQKPFESALSALSAAQSFSFGKQSKVIMFLQGELLRICVICVICGPVVFLRQTEQSDNVPANAQLVCNGDAGKEGMRR